MTRDQQMMYLEGGGDDVDRRSGNPVKTFATAAEARAFMRQAAG